jgi:hypothetical protein
MTTTELEDPPLTHRERQITAERDEARTQLGRAVRDRAAVVAANLIHCKTGERKDKLLYGLESENRELRHALEARNVLIEDLGAQVARHEDATRLRHDVLTCRVPRPLTGRDRIDRALLSAAVLAVAYGFAFDRLAVLVPALAVLAVAGGYLMAGGISDPDEPHGRACPPADTTNPEPKEAS